MKELQWNHWCLWCELCHWAGNWRKRPLTMYFKAYSSYFVFSYNYSTWILFLFQFRVEEAKLSLYIKYKRGFFLFFFLTCEERRNTLVLFHPFLGRFWFSSQERMCLHLPRCVHTVELTGGCSKWGESHGAGLTQPCSAVALDRLVPWKADWKPALTKWAKRVAQGYKCAQSLLCGGSYCHGVLDMQGCLGLLLQDCSTVTERVSRAA